MTAKSFAGWLSFTLYFGAAMNDATTKQRVRFNAMVPPLLEKMRGSDPEVWKPAVREVFEVIGEVMGPDWEPQGEWKDQIALLLDESLKE